MLKSAVLILILVLMTPLANADNWGHWRGPTGNGTAITANPPTEWSETKNVKWKVAIPGKGSGSPVVWEGKVFVVSAVNADGGQPESADQLPQPGQRVQQGQGPVVAGQVEDRAEIRDRYPNCNSSSFV